MDRWIYKIDRELNWDWRNIFGSHRSMICKDTGTDEDAVYRKEQRKEPCGKGMQHDQIGQNRRKS